MTVNTNINNNIATSPNENTQSQIAISASKNTNDRIADNKEQNLKQTIKSLKLSNELSSNFNKISSIELKEVNINQERKILNELITELKNISDFTQAKDKIRQYADQIQGNIEQKKYKINDQEYKLYEKIQDSEKFADIDETKEDILKRIKDIDENKEILFKNKNEIVDKMSENIDTEIKAYEEKSKQFNVISNYTGDVDVKNLTNIAGYVMVALSNASPSNSIRLLS
jgi:hypothetical protein